MTDLNKLELIHANTGVMLIAEVHEHIVMTEDGDEFSDFLVLKHPYSINAVVDPRQKSSTISLHPYMTEEVSMPYEAVSARSITEVPQDLRNAYIKAVTGLELVKPYGSISSIHPPASA